MRLRTLLALASLSVAPAAYGQRWNAAPLRTTTPIPHDGLPESRDAFVAWVDGNAGSLTSQNIQAVREHLYAYISQMAKARRGAFPAQGDTSAFTLFRVAARIGIAGADRVARAIAHDPSQLPPPAPIPGATLAFAPPLFHLSAEDGSWGVCFPYYFMVAPAGRQRPASGVTTDAVVLSTLFAADNSPMGSSQATIMLIAAPAADSAAHVNFWLKQLDVERAEAPREDPKGRWFQSAAGAPVRSMVVVRRLPRAVVIVAYLGNSGTFEANRPHLFDVLATLSPDRCGN